MAKLTTIEGVGPTIEAKLQAAGINSIDALLKVCSSAGGRKSVSAKTNIEEQKLLRFTNHADLMRVKGVGGEYSELLEAAGVDSCAELKMRKPENLVAKMEEVNTQKKLVRQVPSLKMVAGWVEQAKALPKVVSH